jgi:hypothetical protein
MSQIYLNLNNQQAGPYDIPTVNGMLTSGQITAETLGWMQGMANWEPVSSNTFASLGIQLNPQPTTSAVPKPSAPSPQKQMPAQQVKSTPNSNQNSSPSAPGTFQIGQAIGEAFSFYKSNILPSIAWLILVIIMGWIPVVNLIIPLMGVNFYTCVRNFRATGQKMSLGELFDFSRALDKIIGPIVVGIFIAIGYFCLVIPGIILTCMWAFTPCIQGDQPELSFFKAMKESKRYAKGNYIKIFLLVIILAIFAFLGFILLGIGALVTVPVAHVALYCAYDQCKPK